MRRPTLAASVIVLAIAVPSLVRSQGAPVVFTGVAVIPMDRETVLPNQTVIVENGRITYVGGRRSAPAGATSIDARGKFLMPAIAEFHAHVPSGAGAVHAHRTLSLYVLAGVATARGMLGAPMHLALRDSIAAGQLLGPRLLTSGPSFNGNSATSPGAVAAMVRDQKAAGYDLLKIHPGVPRPAFDSLAVVANALRIPFAGHVPLEIGLDVALTSKFSTIDHLDGIVEAMYAGPPPLTPQVNGFFGLGIMRQLDQSRFATIVDRIKSSGVVMVPTQILLDNYANDATGDELTSLPEFKYWVPQQTAAWRTNKNTTSRRLPCRASSGRSSSRCAGASSRRSTMVACPSSSAPMPRSSGTFPAFRRTASSARWWPPASPRIRRCAPERWTWRSSWARKEDQA